MNNDPTTTMIFKNFSFYNKTQIVKKILLFKSKFSKNLNVEFLKKLLNYRKFAKTINGFNLVSIK